MSKTITIDDHVYRMLASLKRDRRDSFTEVIRRHLPHQCDTAGELLDAYESAPPPKINWATLERSLPKGGGAQGDASRW